MGIPSGITACGEYMRASVCLWLMRFNDSDKIESQCMGVSNPSYKRQG